MAHPNADVSTPSTYAWWTSAVERRVVGLSLAGLLGLAILNQAAGSPEWLVAWHVTSAFVLVAGGLIAGRYLALQEEARPTGLKRTRVAALFGLLAVLLVVTYQSRNPGIISINMMFSLSSAISAVVLAFVAYFRGAPNWTKHIHRE